MNLHSLARSHLSGRKFYRITNGWLGLMLCGCLVQGQVAGTDTVPAARADSLHPASPTGHAFVIGEISIAGNRRTKAYIIERELPFKRGDTVQLTSLVQGFEKARDRIINTHLFIDAVISLKGFRGYAADIQIDVKERWYIFPIPYIKPVDRNFTAWAQQGYSLSRFDYGLKYSHFNFTGRNDNLRVWLLTGYTQQVEFAYDQPYADRDLKHGFGLGFNLADVQELNVSTQNNQQFFVNADTLKGAGHYLRKSISGSLRYYFRPGLKTRHGLRLSVYQVTIDSTVLSYNPHYFNYGKTLVTYPELSYVLYYNNIDYPPYPLKGFYLETGLTHRGINADMNLWLGYAKTTLALPLGERTNFVTQNMAVLKLPLHQPFYNQQLFGYGDMYLRGQERYVIDGEAGFLGRNTLLRELFNFSLPFIQSSWSHDRIPIRIYAKAYADYGYAVNQTFRENSLVNRIMYSGGAGVDVVTFYDLVFRFECSVNQLGQTGFYFHIRNDF